MELHVLLCAGDSHARFVRRVDVRDKGEPQLPEKTGEGRGVPLQRRQRDRAFRAAYGGIEGVDRLQGFFLQGRGGFDVRQQAGAQRIRARKLGPERTDVSVAIAPDPVVRVLQGRKKNGTGGFRCHGGRNRDER
jgi:hypothetical protein